MKEKDGELISEIRLRGLKPSQVFKMEQIFDDENFHKKIQHEVDYKLWLKEQEAEEELNEQMSEEVKLKEKENPFIPGSSDIEEEPETEEEKKKRKEKEAIDDEFVPDDKGDPSDNELIPD